MAPQRRDRRNRDLPANLYRFPHRGGQLYYQYRNPQTGAKTGLGYDKDAAVAAANQANQILMTNADLVARITGQRLGITLAEYAEQFSTDVLPRRRVKGEPLSEEYLKETRRILRAAMLGLSGEKTMAHYTQADIATYLNTLQSADAHNQHRSRLVQLWRQAVSDGIVTDNLPERIIKRDLGTRVRQRLSLDEYKIIIAHASTPVQIAMELSLNALQRRKDCQKWRYDDQRDGYAHVVQSKTRKHGPSAFLRIPTNLPCSYSYLGATTLTELLQISRSDGILCPFIVHERPERVRASTEKDHPFQLSCKQISDGFADARKLSGKFEAMPANEQPTFHECLGLGEYLRQQQGWTLKQIQSLRGHTTERMTEHYLDGHSWTTIEMPFAT
jgi:enterobacteria phage integrase